MEISAFRLIFDTGLVVLIWMVQLVIYPSFLFYGREELIHWHKKYARGISYIVIPLMLGQIMIALQQIIMNVNAFTALYFLLVLSNWGITFLIFVPLHAKISSGIYNNYVLRKLVSYNWTRTVLWTTVLVASIYEFFKSLN